MRLRGQAVNGFGPVLGPAPSVRPAMTYECHSGGPRRHLVSLDETTKSPLCKYKIKHSFNRRPIARFARQTI